MSQQEGRLRKRVLVVDDEPDLLRTVGIRLQAAGYDVLKASDAVMAVQVAVTERPDAVVLDIGLPAGGGHAVARNIRQHSRIANTPIIYLTARTGSEDVKQARQQGAHAYLVKPYEPAELLSMIHSAIEGGLSGRMAASHGTAPMAL